MLALKNNVFYSILFSVFFDTSSLSIHIFEVCNDHYASCRIWEKWETAKAFLCYFHCGRNYWCRAVTVKLVGDGVKCLFHDGIFDVDCNSFPYLPDNGYKLLLKNEVYVSPDDNGCKNGGTFSGSCVCTEGFAGSFCSRYVRDCKEALDSGVSLQPGVLLPLMIKPGSSLKAFEGYCNFYGHTVVMVREAYGYNVSFNKSLEQYKYSFGVVENYWMGLEWLYTVTNQGWTYRLQVYCRNQDSNQGFSAYYMTFGIDSEVYDYCMSTGSIWVDPGNEGSDGLGAGRSKIPFCTYDRPCNGYPNTNQGGWWYVNGLEKYALTNPFSAIKFKFRDNDFPGHSFTMAVIRN